MFTFYHIQLIQLIGGIILLVAAIGLMAYTCISGFSVVKRNKEALEEAAANLTQAQATLNQIGESLDQLEQVLGQNTSEKGN